MRKRGDVAERQGEYTAAHAWYRRAARELDALNWAGVIREQAQLDCARSGLAHRQSHFSEAWRYGNLALAQAERIEDWDTAAHAALMVDNLITQMSWSGAHVSRPDVLALHERAGDLLGAARWLSNQAVDRYYEGAWDDAVAMYRDSAEQCARFGHLVSEATAINNIAEIESDRGRYDEALSLFRAARRSWRAIGFGVGIALAQANLGRLATRTGEYGDAEPLLTDAIDRFDALDMASMAGDARLRRVENALLSGAPVPRRWWPAAGDLDDDVVAQIYLRRLRALEAFVLGRRKAAARHADIAVVQARAASVPFDLVLALRVRRGITGGDADDAEIETIHARLGIVAAPAVLPGDDR
jgi:tetratricopeptide (TPR) repeat protein